MGTGPVQVAWASLPGARINRHYRGGDHCDQDGIRQVTRAWHAGIPSWQGAHASIPHMLLTTTCLSQGMPWMPPGRGILGDNISSPPGSPPLPGHFSLQGCGYRAVSARCGYQRIIWPRKSAPRAVFVLFCEFMARVSVVFMAGAQLGQLMAENWHEQQPTLSL